MKKLLLSLALIMATSSVASETKKPYHINMHMGLNVFDDTSYLEDSALYGASVSFYEKEMHSYALQLGYEHIGAVPFEGLKDSSGENITTEINRYYINMIVDGEEELDITPYILVGAGYEDLSHIYEEYAQTKSQAFLNAGLGFKYRIHEYFNITLEARALGKFDSESLDYSGKLGLDYMFGGLWQKRPKLLKALEEPVQEVKRVQRKARTKEINKKKRWITPEVVEAVFAEKDQNPAVLPEKSFLLKDDSVLNMQKNLETLKVQMAQNEALLADKLAKLEDMLAIEMKNKMREKVLLKENKEKVQLQLMHKQAEIKYAENIRVAQEKIAKAESLAKELKINTIELQAHKAEVAAKKAQKLAAMKRAKRLAKQKQIVKAKKLKQKKRLELQRIAKEKQIKRAQEQAEYERLRLSQVVEEKKLVEVVEHKVQVEETDKLYIRNGVVVFAD